MTSLTLNGVTKSFGPVVAVNGVDLEIRDGEFMALVGPSGCGKTTLLRMIAGLEDVTSGEIRFDDVVVNDLPPSRRGIAMVFQSYALYPHMTAYENMAFGLKLDGRTQRDVAREVARVADMLQIGAYLDRLPKHLSGGQRQRVAIGRAIVRDPKVFLFDEPLSNLDAALRVAMRIEIAKIHHSLAKVTMIYVTHDQVEAMTLGDRICLLRNGVVEQVGTPAELYEHPQSLFAAEFIGSPKMNRIEGEFAERFACKTVGVRPEHIDIVGGEGAWRGGVVHTERLGADSYHYVDVGLGTPVIVRELGRSALAAGAQIALAPQKAHLHRFDAAGRRIAN